MGQNWDVGLRRERIAKAKINLETHPEITVEPIAPNKLLSLLGNNWETLQLPTLEPIIQKTLLSQLEGNMVFIR